MPADNRDAKVCPLEGNAKLGLPRLRMKSLRRLVYETWHMELAEADIYPTDFQDAITPEGERLPDVPLSGLQIKLVERHLLAKRMLKMVRQIIEHEDWGSNPLYLVSREQLFKE